MLGLNFAEAAAMASLHPAEFLGLDDLGAIAPGKRASPVLLNDAFTVQATLIDGAAWDSATDTRAAAPADLMPGGAAPGAPAAKRRGEP